MQGERGRGAVWVWAPWGLQAAGPLCQCAEQRVKTRGGGRGRQVGISQKSQTCVSEVWGSCRARDLPGLGTLDPSQGSHCFLARLHPGRPSPDTSAGDSGLQQPWSGLRGHAPRPPTRSSVLATEQSRTKGCLRPARGARACLARGAPRARPRPRTHCGADVYPDERTRLRNTSGWSCTAPRAAGGNETKKPPSARPVLTATARTPLLRHRKAQAERGHDLQTQGVSHLAPTQPIPAKQVTSRPFTAQGNSENGPSCAVNDTPHCSPPVPVDRHRGPPHAGAGGRRVGGTATPSRSGRTQNPVHGTVCDTKPA